MSRLLPIRVVPLASDLPPGALAELLSGVVGDGPAAPFAGAVAGNGFVITRINDYRGTAMPRLHGRLLARPGGGTSVLLRLRPPGTVVVFMAIWFAFLAAVAAVIALAHAQDSARSLIALLAPAAIGALSWLLMAAVHSADSRWAVERLVESVPALRPGGGNGNPGTSSTGGASMIRKSECSAESKGTGSAKET